MKFSYNISVHYFTDTNNLNIYRVFRSYYLQERLRNDIIVLQKDGGLYLFHRHSTKLKIYTLDFIIMTVVQKKHHYIV